MSLHIAAVPAGAFGCKLELRAGSDGKSLRMILYFLAFLGGVAHYFIDVNGRIRFHHFGEGEYDKSEQVIQQLLKEKNSSLKTGAFVQVAGSGVQATADFHDIGSPETYVGYERQENFKSPEKIKRDAATAYTTPGRMDVNGWGLSGSWTVGSDHATLVSAPGSIVFRFHARDLHLVLGPGKDGKPVRFRIFDRRIAARRGSGY